MHTEADYREAARSFAHVGEALGALLDGAARLIELDPVFGGTAVHALDQVTALDARAGVAAEDCSSQARLANERAELIVGWRADELAYRERVGAWEQERHQWEIDMAAHVANPEGVPSPGEPPAEPGPPAPVPAWADLGI